jgi:hypothetical protein
MGVAGRRIDAPPGARRRLAPATLGALRDLSGFRFDDTSHDDAGGTNMIGHRSEPQVGIEVLRERVDRVLPRPAGIGAHGN